MLDLSIDGARLAQQRLSCLSQLHSPVRPAEKLHAQRIFECLDLARERGLRHVEANSSTVDISFLRNRNEISELTQISHRISTPWRTRVPEPQARHVPTTARAITPLGSPANLAFTEPHVDTFSVSNCDPMGIGHFRISNERLAVGPGVRVRMQTGKP